MGSPDSHQTLHNMDSSRMHYVMIDHRQPDHHYMQVYKTEPCSPVPVQSHCGISECEGQMEERCLEQMQSMVVGEVLKDVDTACKLLNITQDPMSWSYMQVQKWLGWTEHMYHLPRVSTLFQGLSGRELCFMSEAQFRQHSAQFGDMLYAHLDIWRSGTWGKYSKKSDHMGIGSILHTWIDTYVESSCAEGACTYPNQPIHLWQFLRELLLRPNNYSRCIRWLNKEKGIFKIEDSAHVARLWGMRKNRPAMNYDKLSRSIRQYYKKGIIRKPDVSRRLVYQFVNPV
ncbi:SAM pointed domain-containing Ets transcription factor-like [Periophthalmus magnuspinnatus]|uniref:Uncharacterized protein n=1 Tax=Periophthalmus magnuspinnatus TaxID=409849 RepID=A0A3B3ZKE9_9GOBI|nr:SAM pointed domain-containing Ets transcription factor-like [Periophthalmus magnuspinnatus]